MGKQNHEDVLSIGRKTLKRILDFIKHPHVPWFIITRVNKISPSLAKILTYGRVDINTKKLWDNLYASGCPQSAEEERHLDLKNKVIHFVSPGSRVLDVGCGSGLLMQMLREQKKCHCVGIDISEVSINIVKGLGFEAYSTKLPNLPSEISNRQFDLITILEVLEHLRHPNKTLRGLKNVLNLRGRLIATVPNNCMKPGEIDAHLHAFTAESFRDLIEPFYNVEECTTVKSGVHEYLVICAKSRA